MPNLSKDESIWTVDMGDEKNRFSPTWLQT